MANRGYLLVWCKDSEEWNGKQTDHYEHYRTKNNVMKAYKKLLDMDNIYSASVCSIIDSTDY
tara:strand:- start:268 stop:453 length:186 start_codon:yes stop_codon:yes gene_type:complete